MDLLSDLDKAKLRVILSYLCFSEKDISNSDHIISIFKALRDNTLPKSISAIIDVKYCKFLKMYDIKDNMAFIGKDRKKAICVMFIYILSKIGMNSDMIDIILECLNACLKDRNISSEMIESLYRKVVSMCIKEPHTHDYMILVERWMSMKDGIKSDVMCIPKK